MPKECFRTLFSNQSESFVNVIFNNNNNKEQTVDLAVTGDICWQYGTSTVGGGNTLYQVTAISCPALSVDNPTEYAWKLYPNPTSNIVRFTISEDTNRVELISVFEEKLQQLSVLKTNMEFDISTYPTGI